MKRASSALALSAPETLVAPRSGRCPACLRADLEDCNCTPLGGDLVLQRERRLRGLLDHGSIVAEHLIHAIHRVVHLPDPAALFF
ncbi:hypothetical protein OKW37_006756 [Paraburkholderia sp. MM5482-R2]